MNVRRAILHVDMDAFYASVEVLRDPTLRGKPVLVGGSGPRGVVASCSYEARAFGIRSAMPSSQATRLCPHAVWISGNHGVYGEYSAKVHECFAAITPVIEPIALDEAFLDVTGAVRLFGDPPAIAERLRADVFAETGLWCSVGIAGSKLLAKLASECAKPSLPGKPPRQLPPGSERTATGVVRVLDGHEVAFIQSHPVEALWGVGPATRARLDRYGVRTVGDLASLPLDAVVRSLGKAAGTHLHQLAHAIDDRPVEADRALKSVGHEETFATDRRDLAGLRVDATRMADAVSNRMRDAAVVGRTVSIKVKFADFKMVTRSKTLPSATGSGIRIAEIAHQLMQEQELADRMCADGVRLLGVSVASLQESAPNVVAAPVSQRVASDGSGGEPVGSADGAVQLDLFVAQAAPAAGDGSDQPTNSPPQPDPAFDRAVAAVRERFGDAALAPASLATERGLRIKQRGDTQWGPPAQTPQHG